MYVLELFESVRKNKKKENETGYRLFDFKIYIRMLIKKSDQFFINFNFY